VKRLLVIAASVLFTLFVVAIVGVLAAPSFIDFNSYKAQATEQIKSATGHDVAFNGNVSLGIFPGPHVSLKDVVVAAPTGFADETLARFDALDVRVKMAPLFTGAVEVASVSLVGPVVNLETKKDGSSNWMTAELEAMQSGENGDENAADGSDVQDDGGAGPAVTLDLVRIEDGVVQYKAAGSEPVIVRDITMDLSAKSLQGPFKVDGAFQGFDQAFEVSGKVDAFANLEEPLSVVVAASVEPAGVDVNYKGVLDVAAQSVQGQANVGFSDGSLKAFLTASADKVDLTDIVLQAAGHEVTGGFSSTLSPVKFNGKVKVDGTNAAISGSYDDVLNVAVNADRVNFDEIMKSASKGEKSSGRAAGGSSSGKADAAGGTGSPVDVNFDVAVGTVVYKTQDLKGLKAVGSLRGTALSLQNVSLDDAASASVALKGRVGNLQTLSGLDLSVSGKVGDVKKLASFADFDASSLPQQLKSLSGEAVVKGSMNVLDTTATVKALGGSFTAQGKVKNLQDKPDVSGLSVRAQHPNFNRVMQIFAPSAPVYASWGKAFDFKANVEMRDDIVRVTEITSKVAGTTMNGALALDSGAVTPSLSGALRFGDLVMRSSASTAPAGGATSSGGGGSARGGKWSGETMDSEWLRAATVALDIKASSLVYETWDLKSPSIKFSMKDGVLSIQDLKAGLYGGSLQMASVIKAASGTQGMNIAADTTFKGVNLEKLAGSFIGTRIVRASGDADLALKVNGSGLSQAALMSSLNGDGSLTGGKITMEGFDLARFARAMSIDNKPGDTATGLWKTSTKGGTTQFDRLDGVFDISDGVVKISKLDMTGPEANLGTVGQVSLPKWTIATTHKISLTEEDVPPFEVKISGSLDNPGNTFGQGAIQNYLQQKLKRKLGKVLGDKLDLGGGDAPIEQQLFNKFLGDKLGGSQKAANDNAQSLRLFRRKSLIPLIIF